MLRFHPACEDYMVAWIDIYLSAACLVKVAFAPSVCGCWGSSILMLRLPAVCSVL